MSFRLNKFEMFIWFKTAKNNTENVSINNVKTVSIKTCINRESKIRISKFSYAVIVVTQKRF